MRIGDVVCNGCSALSSERAARVATWRWGQADSAHIIDTTRVAF